MFGCPRNRGNITQCVTGASRNNEGKLHLGFVYGNDPSLATAKLMTRSALSFRRIIRRWIGEEVNRIPVSTPFYYQVARDGQLTTDKCQAYFSQVHRLCLEHVDVHGLDYFGKDLRAGPAQVSNPDEIGLSASAGDVFSTSEIAIDPEHLAKALDARVRAEARIGLHLECEVHRVRRLDRGFEVTFRQSGEFVRERYDCVVNALWDGRLRIDEQLGLLPTRPWLFRYKELVRIESDGAADVPSVTIIQGPYGDVVNYGDGQIYMSWYPAGLRATTDDVMPASAADVVRNRNPESIKVAMRAALAQFAPLLECVASSEIKNGRIGGGWIFGWGESGIEDRTSGLHKRFDVGPQHADGYISVDAGKLTSAPLFALAVADMIAPHV